MTDFIYEMLSKIGYTHPLHPPITHIPIGLVIGAFLFGLAGRLFERPSLIHTARHCSILALIAIPPAIILGFMDWQHFYAGALLFPIVMKIALASMLLIFSLVAVIVFKENKASIKILAINGFCLIIVAGIGFFGGELVYGTKTLTGEIKNELARKGAKLFAESCALCHYIDKTETKIGPGLKGLFKREKLPLSGRAVSEDNIRKVLKTPIEIMPPFENLEEGQVEAIIAFLKIL